MFNTRPHRIRESTRQIVRALGMLGAAHQDLGVTNSQVHALIEIERQGPLTAVEIAKALQLEKSSVSRLLQNLVLRNYLTQSSDTIDGRRKVLSLTAAGRATLKRIHAAANERVTCALANLSAAETRTVEAGLALYAQALAAAEEQK